MKFAINTAFLIIIFSTANMYAETHRTTNETEIAIAQKKRIPLSLSLAYAGENIIHPGALFSVDIVPLQKDVHEFVVSPNAGFFVFRPFYVSLLTGVRAQYNVHLPFGLAFRFASVSVSYKHKFLTADTYTVIDGKVEEVFEPGYGNIHLLATTGLEYNFSDKANLPFSTFFDFGISAEPYFGVFRFHIELYAGITYHLIGSKR